MKSPSSTSLFSQFSQAIDPLSFQFAIDQNQVYLFNVIVTIQSEEA